MTEKQERIRELDKQARECLREIRQLQQEDDRDFYIKHKGIGYHKFYDDNLEIEINFLKDDIRNDKVPCDIGFGLDAMLDMADRIWDCLTLRSMQRIFKHEQYHFDKYLKRYIDDQPFSALTEDNVGWYESQMINNDVLQSARCSYVFKNGGVDGDSDEISIMVHVNGCDTLMDPPIGSTANAELNNFYISQKGIIELPYEDARYKHIMILTEEIDEYVAIIGLIDMNEPDMNKYRFDTSLNGIYIKDHYTVECGEHWTLKPYDGFTYDEWHEMCKEQRGKYAEEDV